MTSGYQLLVSLLILAAISGLIEADTPIRRCSNNAPLPLMVQIDDCSELPCDLCRGTNSHMAIQFVATKNSMTNLRAEVRWTTLGAQIPFEMEEERSNVCKNLMFDAYCPLDAGEDVTYHLVMPVSEHQPEVPIKIEVTLVDRTDNSVVACFVSDARVKKHSMLHK